MKANRKFLKGDDEAVSPVIAVILMVAITVVLAATVYVWVSGFGAQSSSPAKTLSLTSDGPINANGEKTFTVASASPGLKYSDLTFTLDGDELDYDSTLIDNTFCVATSTACVATASWSADTVVSAGNQITIADTALSGQSLRVLDANANSVILTITVG